MRFSTILAVDKNNLIGDGDKIPWHISNDFKHFKKITTGKVVIMGRNTFEYIGRPLPNRINVVLTSDTSYWREGVIILHTISELYDYCEIHNQNNDDDDLFIIGGANLIGQVYKDIDTFYITHIDKEFEGDTHVDIDYKSLNLIKNGGIEVDDTVDFDYSFCEYIK